MIKALHTGKAMLFFGIKGLYFGVNAQKKTKGRHTPTLFREYYTTEASILLYYYVNKMKFLLS